MSAHEDGGPAFPRNPHSGEPSDDGMTLRDYFAAKALPALCADYRDGARQTGFDHGWMDGVAMDAYEMADAMLKARSRT